MPSSWLLFRVVRRLDGELGFRSVVAAREYLVVAAEVWRLGGCRRHQAEGRWRGVVKICRDLQPLRLHSGAKLAENVPTSVKGHTEQALMP